MWYLEAVMQPGSLFPKRFSSRLSLVTFLAGLIPIIIFAVLLNIYGDRISNELTTSIEEGYGRDLLYSEGVLREIGESTVRSKVIEITHQLDLVIQSVPWMRLSDFRNDPRFREMVLQKVGRTGRTALLDSNNVKVLIHNERGFENKEFASLFSNLPDFRLLIMKSAGGQMASGYYDSKDTDGKATRKYMYIAPLQNMTADHVRLSLACVIDVEEFSRPITEYRAIHNATKHSLVVSTKSVVGSFRQTAFLYMGLGILAVSILAYGMGISLSRVVTRLREATSRINRGDFSGHIEVSATGEVATLVRDFNTMVDRLAATTVSKELLEESEARLKDTNRELLKEIEERERTEKELAAEKERLSVTLASIGDGVITSDRSGRVVLMNNAAETLTGWLKEQAAGKMVNEVFRTLREIPFNPLIDSERLKTGREGIKNPLNHKIMISRDGTERLIAETSSPMSDSEGKRLGTVVVFRDVTLQRRAEEEFMKARKLESLGILASGIAHDFNSLLTVISGNLAFSRINMGPEDKVVRKLVDAEKACLQGKELSYQLLCFARGGRGSRSVVETAGLIERTVRACLAQSSLDCLFSFPEDLCHIEVDEGQIAQVIYRMIETAEKAMGNDTTLIVAGENIPITRGNRLPLKEGMYVRVSIEDKGVDHESEETLDAADTPAPQTTTLGLSICYSIVQDHGGLITLESRAGGGRLFHLYLPAVPVNSRDLSI
jgi:PAS domain S-box-containing protein